MTIVKHMFEKKTGGTETTLLFNHLFQMLHQNKIYE